MNIKQYQQELEDSRLTGKPVIIRETKFELPGWDELLQSFDKSYNTKLDDNKTVGKLYGSILEDAYIGYDLFQFTDLKPYNLSKSYLSPVGDFITQIYGRPAVASSIKINFVTFKLIADSVHLDPTDMAYWHIAGKTKWRFNKVSLENRLVYLNGLDITDLITKHIDIQDDSDTSVLAVRDFLSDYGEQALMKYNPEIVYYEDVVFEPGDIAIIPKNCYHGFYSLGPRAGITWKIPV